MSDAPELARCPFCGGEAKIEAPYRKVAICNSCLARGPIPNSSGTEAAAAWNRRAPRVATADDADQLASALWARNELQHLAYSEIALVVDCTLRAMGYEVRE